MESLKPAAHSTERWIILRVQVIWKNHFIQNTGNHLCFVVFIGNKTVRKFIMVAMAVLTSEPADHQMLLHSTFLFSDAWTGISIAKYPMANRTKMGFLAALNKKH